MIRPNYPLVRVFLLFQLRLFRRSAALAARGMVVIIASGLGLLKEGGGANWGGDGMSPSMERGSGLLWWR
jgi:hypothetical protein